MSLRRSLVLALALLTACGKKDKDNGGGDQPGTGTASGTAAQPEPKPAPGTHVFVDDKDVATVTAEQVATWPRLDTLVPEPPPLLSPPPFSLLQPMETSASERTTERRSDIAVEVTPIWAGRERSTRGGPARSR